MKAQLWGGVLVTLAGLWGGWQRRQWYVRRRRTLSAFCHGLARMEGELQAWETDTWTLLSSLERGEAGAFFRTLSRRRGELDRMTLAMLWADTLAGQALPLRGEELALLNRPGQILGRYDGGTQAFLLRQVRMELETCLEQARQEERRMGTAAVLLGLSAGVGVTVLLW